MSGALDDFADSRRSAVWRAGALAHVAIDRLPGVVTGTAPPALPAPTNFERVADDIWSMGLTTDATVMAYMRDELTNRGVTRAEALVGAEAHRVVVAGVVTHRQHPETARGAVFLNLEDETGHVNVIFSKGAWPRHVFIGARHVRKRAGLPRYCGGVCRGTRYQRCGSAISRLSLVRRALMNVL